MEFFRASRRLTESASRVLTSQSQQSQNARREEDEEEEKKTNPINRITN